MQKLFSIFVVALTTFKQALAIQMDGSVMVLNKDNFDEEVRNYKNLLVEFYAPGW
jgi:hypothetical protein